MRILLITAAALLTFGAAANASPPTGDNPQPKTGVLCLDVGGATRPAVCRGAGGRLEDDYDICQCENAQRVEAPLCDKGERPITENLAYERARKEAARDGSLVGDLYEGRQMCVRPRNG